MVPDVGSPVGRIAGSGGTKPFDNGRGRGSGIGTVFPHGGVAGTLKRIDYRVSVGDDLVIIHFQIGDFTSLVNPDLGVVDEVLWGRIGSVSQRVEFAARTGEGGVKLFRLTTQGGIADHGHRASRRTRRAGIVFDPPVGH